MAEGSQRLVPFDLATLDLANSLQNPHGTPYTSLHFRQFMKDNPNAFKNLSIDQWLENIQSYGLSTAILPDGNDLSIPNLLFPIQNRDALAIDQYIRAQYLSQSILQYFIDNGHFPYLWLLDGPGRFTYYLFESLFDIFEPQGLIDDLNNFVRTQLFYCNIDEGLCRFQMHFFPIISNDNILHSDIVDAYVRNMSRPDMIFYFNFMGFENHEVRRVASSMFRELSITDFSSCDRLITLFDRPLTNYLVIFTVSIRGMNKKCKRFIRLIKSLPGYEKISERGFMRTYKIGNRLNQPTIDPYLNGAPQQVQGQVQAVPGQAEAVPGQAEAVPGQAEAVPGQAEAVPGQAEVVQAVQGQAVQGQAVQGQAVQGQAQEVAVPGQAVAVPGQAVAVPGQAEAVAVPGQALAVEQEYQPIILRQQQEIRQRQRELALNDINNPQSRDKRDESTNKRKSDEYRNKYLKYKQKYLLLKKSLKYGKF